ncbi:PH domain-containing protein [Streptomyces prasinus]|uniref:PH domain-containing protein n=1 Tax=Streptomyces prasinus TaxID=67345 RepID=UPI0033BC3956
MTTPEHQPSDPEPSGPDTPAESAEPAGSAGPTGSSPSSEGSKGTEGSGATQAPADRVHRSNPGIAGGVLMIGVTGWMCVDAMISGEGRAPWLALAVLLFIVPLVVAYTLLPAVHAGEDRLRVRNPFRTVELPWGRIASLRSGYSSEVVTDDGTTYQLWALPVSLRARKRAARQEMRAAGERAHGVDVRAAGRAPGVGDAFRRGGATAPRAGGAERPERAPTDRAMDELRELHEKRRGERSAQGEVTVRWAYEIMAPTLAGAILLAVLLAVG